tara:strand:+ start:591 stop:2045 length:1455 start_codon:yes stop_codon:yes gene_type:complete
MKILYFIYIFTLFVYLCCGADNRYTCTGICSDPAFNNQQDKCLYLTYCGNADGIKGPEVDGYTKYANSEMALPEKYGMGCEDYGNICGPNNDEACQQWLGSKYNMVFVSHPNPDVEWIPYVKDENDIYRLPSAETRAATNTIPTYIGPTQTRNYPFNQPSDNPGTFDNGFFYYSKGEDGYGCEAQQCEYEGDIIYVPPNTNKMVQCRGCFNDWDPCTCCRIANDDECDVPAQIQWDTEKINTQDVGCRTAADCADYGSPDYPSLDCLPCEENGGGCKCCLEKQPPVIVSGTIDISPEGDEHSILLTWSEKIVEECDPALFGVKIDDVASNPFTECLVSSNRMDLRTSLIFVSGQKIEITYDPSPGGNVVKSLQGVTINAEKIDSFSIINEVPAVLDTVLLQASSVTTTTPPPHECSKSSFTCCFDTQHMNSIEIKNCETWWVLYGIIGVALVVGIFLFARSYKKSHKKFDFGGRQYRRFDSTNF